MSTQMVHVRIDDKVKARASKALGAMGLSISDAVRMLLTRIVAERRLPFDVCIPHVPNAKTAKVLRDAMRGKGLLPAQPLEEYLAEMRADVE